MANIERLFLPLVASLTLGYCNYLHETNPCIKDIAINKGVATCKNVDDKVVVWEKNSTPIVLSDICEPHDVYVASENEIHAYKTDYYELVEEIINPKTGEKEIESYFLWNSYFNGCKDKQKE